MDKLKPCPFCGNVEPLVVMDDETEALFGVCCYKCEAAIKPVFWERKDAVDAWNRREKGERMTLKEAVKTIKDYCSKKECEDCIFAELYKIDRYNGKIWYCKLRGTPYEWGEPPEAIIEAEVKE